MKYRIVLMIFVAAAVVACAKKKPEEDPVPEPDPVPVLTPEQYYGRDNYVEVSTVSTIYPTNGNSSTTSFREVFSYDPSGKPIKIELYNAQILSQVSVFTYATKTKKESMYSVSGGEQTLIEEVETVYVDDEMTMAAEERHTTPGKPALAKRTEREWENGRLMKQRDYQMTSSLVEYLEWEVTYSYAEDGLVVVKKQHSERYNPNGSVYSKSDGTMTSTYKDPEKKYRVLYEAGFNKNEYIYNDDNLLIAINGYYQNAPLSMTRISYSGNIQTEYYAAVSTFNRSKLSQESTKVFKYSGDPLEYEAISDNSTSFLFP